jgi:hypothetical protein
VPHKTKKTTKTRLTQKLEGSNISITLKCCLTHFNRVNYLGNNVCVDMVHCRGKPAFGDIAVVSGATVAMETIGIVATQVRLTGSLASHGAQCSLLPGAQLLLMIVLTLSESVLEVTLAEEMETVAELAGP